MKSLTIIRWKAAAVSAALTALFLIVYPLCNWLTTRRTSVPSFHFDWERSIPFVPLLIVPYMSIDFFFVIAPFLARSAPELRTLAWRLAAAILICAACFLAFPLRFAFPPPPVSGFLGAFFDHFRTLDGPFNQCPSLHLALATILADHYLHRTRGITRVLLAIWFLLIAASPLLVYQHHAIDIIAGSLLGILCIHFIRETSVRHAVVPNLRVAAYYALASTLLTLLAFTSHWLLALLWPALSLALAAAAYAFLGAGIYAKSHGTLPWTTRILLGPLLIGQYLSLLWYSRHSPPWNQLTGNLYIGRHLSSTEAAALTAQGITAVLDLTCEFAETPTLRNTAYLNLPILDLTAPTIAQVEQALTFIRSHTAHGRVYIHCKAGYSRTAAIAGTYLLAENLTATPQETVTKLHQARPNMIIRPEIQTLLSAYQPIPTPLPANS